MIERSRVQPHAALAGQMRALFGALLGLFANGAAKGFGWTVGVICGLKAMGVMG